MTEQIKREKRIRIIRLLSFGLSGSINLLSRRGAVYFIDVDYISCEIERLINYLDDNRLRKIIHDLYRDKRKGKLIYIEGRLKTRVIEKENGEKNWGYRPC